MHEDEDNDGKFPNESPVEVRYLRSKQEEQADRERWPWLPGTIVKQCGPDEWYVCIEVREMAVLRDGRRAPRGTASRNLYYPCCFRDSSEIRPRTASSDPAAATRRGWPGERGPGDPLLDGGRGLRALTPSAVVLCSSPDGLLRVPRRPCIAIPVTARRLLSITPGDELLLAAAPEYRIVIVHTMQAMEDMLVSFYAEIAADELSQP